MESVLVSIPPPPFPLKQVISFVLFIHLFIFVPKLNFCPLSSTDLVSVTGAWMQVFYQS